MSRYPEYQESGVGWLGAIPAHWDTRRLRAGFANVVESGSARETRGLQIALDDIESWTGRIVGDAAAGRLTGQVKRFRAGDILFGKLRPYLAKVVRTSRVGVCVGEFLVLRRRLEDLEEAYYEALLRSPRFIETANSAAAGAKMPRTEWVFLGAARVPVPPLDEQRGIARFLDRAGDRMRRSIAAKERRIGLLEEQKRAVIHRAVTGGLDPSVPRKPSGVSWLGDIPQHWETLRLRTRFRNVVEKVPPQSAPGPQLALEHVESWTGRILGPRSARLTGQLKRYRSDEILFGKLRPYLAKVARVPGGGACVSEFLVLRHRNPDDSVSYYEHLLRSPGFIHFVNGAAVGAKMPRAEWLDIGATGVPVPPPAEQREIAGYLDRVSTDFYRAIAATRRQIDRLREYRDRLVADVVTGRLDVRDAV